MPETAASLIRQAIHTLTVPAAEYCPAIPDAWAILERALALALQAESEARDAAWQPISTAPKLGHILLADSEFVGEGYWVVALEDGVDYMGNDAGFMDAHYRYFRCGRSFGAAAYRDPGLQPTHWMPLPKPPAPLAEKEQTR
jgi:hypothetical protein